MINGSTTSSSQQKNREDKAGSKDTSGLGISCVACANFMACVSLMDKVMNWRTPSADVVCTMPLMDNLVERGGGVPNVRPFMGYTPWR